jgi:hypothetical protein
MALILLPAEARDAASLAGIYAPSVLERATSFELLRRQLAPDEAPAELQRWPELPDRGPFIGGPAGAAPWPSGRP